MIRRVAFGLLRSVPKTTSNLWTSSKIPARLTRGFCTPAEIIEKAIDTEEMREKTMEDTEDLRLICQMLGTEYLPINEEIDLRDKVRLIDEQEKRFLGVFSMQTAIAKAKSLGKDVVLVNKKVSPPLCKLTFHKQQLYERFIKEIVSMPQDDEKTKRRVRAKVVTLKPRMTMNDLKNKVRQAHEMAEKYESVKVAITFLPADEDKARNLFDNFVAEARLLMDEVDEAGDSAVDKKKKSSDEGMHRLLKTMTSLKMKKSTLSKSKCSKPISKEEGRPGWLTCQDQMLVSRLKK